MASETADRRRAGARALAGILGSAKGRQFMIVNGYQSETQVVIALPEDTLGEVMDRVRGYRPPVVVAVHMPKGRDCFADMGFMVFKPSAPPAREDQQDSFGAGGTIGMLWALMCNEKRPEMTFQLTNWDGIAAHSFALAGSH